MGEGRTAARPGSDQFFLVVLVAKDELGGPLDRGDGLSNEISPGKQGSGRPLGLEGNLARREKPGWFQVNKKKKTTDTKGKRQCLPTWGLPEGDRKKTGVADRRHEMGVKPSPKKIGGRGKRRGK